MADAAMDLWAPQSALPSWWNATLMMSSNPAVTQVSGAADAGMMSQWNENGQYPLPAYITNGVTGEIIATGVSSSSYAGGYAGGGAYANGVAQTAGGLGATTPAGAAVAAVTSNTGKYILYGAIVLAVIIVIFKMLRKKPQTVVVQQSIPQTSGD